MYRIVILLEPGYSIKVASHDDVTIEKDISDDGSAVWTLEHDKIFTVFIQNGNVRIGTLTAG